MPSSSNWIRTLACSAVVICVAMLAPQEAHAHGIWGHIHVTGWAIEDLPEGELKDFFSEPEVLNAALFGGSFPDSGYFPIQGKNDDNARAYAEFTHWEPFIQRFVEWIRAEDPPPWDELHSRKRVAFLLGCAAHGLQDEVFDSLYLDLTAFHEDGDQDKVDPGTDGFLALEGQLRFVPEPWIPLDTLQELYAELDAEVTPELIESAAEAMTSLYVNDTFGLEFAASLGEAYEEELPWSRAHFMDPKVMGSLASEIGPTRGYLEAIWARLHEGLDPDATVVAMMPPSPAELSTGAVAGYETRVTWIYGAGVQKDSAQVTCVDAAGEPVSGALHGSRWGAEFTRLHSFQPAEDLLIEGVMTCGLEPGLSRIDEVSTTVSHQWTARVPCWTPETMTCSEPDPVPDPDAGSGAPAAAADGCAGGVPSPSPASTLLLLSIGIWALRRRETAGL
jgi:hypothetical protein